MSRHNVNRIRYQCVQCENLWYPKRCELTRAAHVRCPACGSLHVWQSKLGRKRMSEQQAAVDVQRERIDRMTGR